MEQIIRDLHFILDSLRLPMVEEFLNKILERVDWLYKLCMKDAPGHETELALVSSLEHCFRELHALKPDEEGVSMGLEVLQSLVAAKKKETEISKIMEVLIALVEEGGKEGDEAKAAFLLMVSEINDQMLGMQEQMKVTEAKQTETVEEAWCMIIDWVAKGFLGEEPVLETAVVNKGVYIIESLPDLLQVPVQHFAAVADWMGAAVHLVEKTKEVMPQRMEIDELCKQPGLLEKMSSMKRALLRLGQAMQNHSSATDPRAGVADAGKSMDVVQRLASAQFVDVAARLRAAAEREFTKELHEMGVMAGGRKDGKLWCEGLNSKMKWTALVLKFRDEALFQIDPKALVTGIESLKKVTLRVNSQDKRSLGLHELNSVSGKFRTQTTEKGRESWALI